MKIKMRDEKQRYTVQGYDTRFVVMTKPFNVRKTYLYTVADLKLGVRGHFGKWGPPYDVDTPEGASEILLGLNSGEHELLSKTYVELNFCEITQLKRLEHETR